MVTGHARQAAQPFNLSSVSSTLRRVRCHRIHTIPADNVQPFRARFAKLWLCARHSRKTRTCVCVCARAVALMLHTHTRGYHRVHLAEYSITYYTAFVRCHFRMAPGLQQIIDTTTPVGPSVWNVHTLHDCRHLCFCGCVALVCYKLGSGDTSTHALNECGAVEFVWVLWFSVLNSCWWVNISRRHDYISHKVIRQIYLFQMVCIDTI